MVKSKGLGPRGEPRRLGVHTSIAGGVHLALDRARELGCNTMQIFSHNPRQWAVADIPREIAARFIESKKACGISPVFVHSSYLINLAAADAVILAKSIELLKRELDLADALEADYVVVHTGSASGESASEGRRRAVEALRKISCDGSWNAGILLENTAGERGDITSHIEDLAWIINEVNSQLIAGITFDTCHAFAAGYDIADGKALSGLIDKIDKLTGLDKVKLIHMNDAKKGLGSGVDRHWHIGEGEIGVRGLAGFVNHPAFRNVPLILETPKKSEEDDLRNLKVVRGFLGN
ncbi:MAG TPA: deoxyribonuclease IV [Dissulfurispiraceae bacterium]|nr:deoxyribonuclease IV [Dissulfurispiraceae bacterium]